MTEHPLLEVEDLSIRYRSSDGEDVRAVTDASFSIGESEYFGLVGESGSGKSTIAKAIVGGLADNGEIESGTIRFRGKEIQDLSEAQYREEVRWKEISIIPQASMNSLDPTLKISTQAIEIAKRHTDWTKSEALDRLRELFEVVGLPGSRIHDYPSQFSGGMKQRAVIVLALYLDPSVIIADEPTTALDVIMQDQILDYIDNIKQIENVSLLMITHDISVVMETCDRAGVMHGGLIAETGTVDTIANNPRHPYTILLQQAFPDIRYPDRELNEIEGTPPTLKEEIDFCTFADRCPWAMEECQRDVPPLTTQDGNESHRTSCFRSQEMEQLADEYLTKEERRE